MKKIGLSIILFLCVFGLSSIQADEPSIIGKWAIVYSREIESEQYKFYFQTLKITNTALSFSSLHVFHNRVIEPPINPYTTRNNLLVIPDADYNLMTYNIQIDTLFLFVNGERHITAKRLSGINKISGMYYCYIGPSNISLEILDDTNALLTTLQRPYNQQPGKYIISGEYFILTLNGKSYSFKILENNAVLFGTTQGIQGAFIRYE